MSDTPTPAPAAAIPAGMIRVFVNAIIGTEVGPLTVLSRPAVLPAGVQPTFVKFPSIDPDGRLRVLGDLGVSPEWEVRVHEWDFDADALNLHLKVTKASARLSEESIALLVGLYRQAGWDYLDAKARAWPERLVKHKEMLAETHKHGHGHGHAPNCPNHPANHSVTAIPIDLSGVNVGNILDNIFAEPEGIDEYEDEALPPPKKKRKKKRNKPKGEVHDAGDDEKDDPAPAGPTG